VTANENSTINVPALRVWPIEYLLSHRKAMPMRSGPWIPKWLSTVTSALDIAAVLLLVWMILFDTSISQRIPPELYAILAIALVAVVLTAVAVIFTLLAWKDRYWSLPERAYYTIVTLEMAVFIWILYYWNLIGPKF
jgi:hypothetical protein